MPDDPWGPVLPLVVLPVGIGVQEWERRFLGRQLVLGGPSRAPLFLDSEDKARNALQQLAEWWVENRVSEAGARKRVRDFKKTLEAMAALEAEWNSFPDFLRAQFLDGLKNEHWFHRNSIGGRATRDSIKVGGILQEFSSAANATLVRFSDDQGIPGKSIHRAPTKNPAADQDLIGLADSQVIICLARWFFSATGRIPGSWARAERDDESAVTDFEILLEAVRKRAFGRKGPTLEGIKKSAIQPALREFRRLSNEGSGPPNLGKTPVKE